MATKVASEPQGMYIPCPCNPVFHRRPVALQIHRGPKVFFAKCECGIRIYLPPGWSKDFGLTEAQAVRRGLLVTTSNIIRPPKTKG